MEPALSAPPAPSAPSSRIGQRVGPFQLVERIDLWRDVGLYRAERPAGSRQPRVVAIRLAEAPRDEQAGAWVRHEYDVLRALDDPRIPVAHGYYSSQVAVAQSHVDGLSFAELFALRREGALQIDIATAIDVVVELAQALRHAHGAAGPDGPVVHAQLCPARVMLRRDGQVVLTGFGTAPRPLPPGYTPPEVAAGAFLDPRTDQWALGAFLVELVLGLPLYTGATAPDRAAIECRVEPWVRRVEQRHPAVARLLAKLLAPAAGARFAREMELVSALLALGREAPGRADRVGLITRARTVLDARAAAARAEQSAAREAEEAAQAAEEARRLAAREAQEAARREARRAAMLAAQAREAEARAAEAERRQAQAAAKAAAEARAAEARAAREAAEAAAAAAEATEAQPPPAPAPLPAIDPLADLPEVGLALGGTAPVDDGLDLPPPAAAGPAVSVAVAEFTDDDISLGLDGRAPDDDGPVFPQFDPLEDPAALPGESGPVLGNLGPSGGFPRRALDAEHPDEDDGEDNEVTEILSPASRDEVERTELDTRSPEERAAAARPAHRPPGTWLPSEYAAMAATAVLVLSALGFLWWRFA